MLMLQQTGRPKYWSTAVSLGRGIGVFITANWAWRTIWRSGPGRQVSWADQPRHRRQRAISRLTGPGIDWLNALQPGDNLGYDALFIGAAVLALLSLLALRRIPDRVGRQAPAPI
jgi:hypothetical protein